MAELTDEEKIVIGVCVGLGSLVLIAIICVLCYICLCKKTKPEKRKRRRRHYVKERIFDEYRPPPYDPMPLPYPPPPPQPVRLPPPVPYVQIPTPRPIKIDYTDPYRETEYRYSKWDGVFRNDPIVISLGEPEVVSDRRYLQDPETIYLKYNDDQALLRTQNYERRANFAVEARAPPPLRRSRSVTGIRSFTVTKHETPYVGEWYRKPDNLNFNESALKQGRDPFLWK